MNKFINLLLLNVIGSATLLLANENIFTNAKVAIQFIEKNDVQFIATQESDKFIRGSKILNIKLLSSETVLGNMPCEPFYSCPKKIEKYFSRLGIVQNKSLFLYDNSYGVYASTLYTLLESVGHKNMTIIDGGINAVEKLDPNQELYDKYKDEFKVFEKLIEEDNATISEEKRESIKNSLVKKMEMVRPHLLIDKNLNISMKERSNYVIKKKNTDYLLSTTALRGIVQKVKSHENNITIIDACPMIDIVGNKYGNYLFGVTPFSWKNLIDKKENRLKSQALLERFFMKIGLKKDEYNYIYCMSESSKAFFMMLVMRELGYTKVKAYTGNWSVWKGDSDE